MLPGEGEKDITEETRTRQLISIGRSRGRVGPIWERRRESHMNEREMAEERRSQKEGGGGEFENFGEK